MNDSKAQPNLSPARTSAAPPASEFMQVLNQPHKGTCEYVPYGASDKIKLTVHIIQNLIAVRTKSGKTCSEKDAIKFLAMCQAKRLNPFEGDCFLIGYDGKDGPQFALVTAHQTYLKRAELHPEFDGMESGLIIIEGEQMKEIEGDFYMPDSQKVVGGWARVFFKGRSHPMYKRLRLSRFQKGFGVWQEDGAGMICKCAEADALRSSFPTMLGGLYMREEMEPEAKTTKPDFSTPGKPLFAGTQPAAIDATPPPEIEQPQQSEPEPMPESEAPQSEPEQSQQSEQPANNPLKALRGLLTQAKVKEGALLDFLASTGMSDGTAGSLEELVVSNGGSELVLSVYNNWGKTLAELKKVKA